MNDESNTAHWLSLAALLLNSVLVPGLVQLTRYLKSRFKVQDERLDLLQSQLKSLRRDMNQRLSESAAAQAATEQKLKSVEAILLKHTEKK